MKITTLNNECRTCVRLYKNTCKGKTTAVPCLAYKSNNTYAQEKIAEMKNMIKK